MKVMAWIGFFGLYILGIIGCLWAGREVDYSAGVCFGIFLGMAYALGFKFMLTETRK